jgi:hypothetical protein
VLGDKLGLRVGNVRDCIAPSGLRDVMGRLDPGFASLTPGLGYTFPSGLGGPLSDGQRWVVGSGCGMSRPLW